MSKVATTPPSGQDAESLRELEALEALMKHQFFNGPPSHNTKQSSSSNHPSTEFQYEALPPNDTIRVLKLDFGKKTDPIRGSLLKVSLNDIRLKKYEALSYAWESQEKPYKIFLSEGVMSITESLYTALIRLRLPTSKRIIWIDAICINQQDNDEKATQIILMPRIYSHASCVLVWLGEDNDNGKVALQLLEKIAAADFSTLKIQHISEQWMVDRGLPCSGDPLWYTLLEFWRRAWFRRAWVVPEFILAKYVLMICGDWEIPWRKLASAFEKMVEYNLVDRGTTGDLEIEKEKVEAFSGAMGMRMMMDIKHSTSFGSLVTNVIRSFVERDESSVQELEIGGWGRIPGMKELVAVMRDAPETNSETIQIVEQAITKLLQDFGVPDTGVQLPLAMLLTIFEKTEATLPRDKLFALLGLAQDGQSEELRPNYDESTEMVLLRYGRYFVKNGHGMSMLSQAGFSLRDTPKLPSWVADYTSNDLQKTRPLSLSSLAGLCYSAASSVEPRIRLTETHDEVLVSGSHIGTVIRQLRYPHESEAITMSEYMDEVDQYLDAAEAMVLTVETPYVNGEPRFNVLWRTLICNMALRPMIAPSEWGLEYKLAREDIRAAKVSGVFPDFKNTGPYFGQVMTFAMPYNLCEMENGLVGMLPAETQPGDEIYVFSGGRMPFAVRKFDEQKYRLVGEGYVHGVMAGEALRFDDWKEVDIRLC